MIDISSYSEEEMAEIYERHVDMIYRICFSYMKNTYDTEDAVQNTFLKLFCSATVFDENNHEHEKAWLIRTAQNVCKDHLKSKCQQNQSIDDCKNLIADETLEIDETLEAVLALPIKYRLPIYLYYYEGYKCEDIAKTIKIPTVTVRSIMYRARKILKIKLGGEDNE